MRVFSKTKFNAHMGDKTGWNWVAKADGKPVKIIDHLPGISCVVVDNETIAVRDTWTDELVFSAKRYKEIHGIVPRWVNDCDGAHMNSDEMMQGKSGCVFLCSQIWCVPKCDWIPLKDQEYANDKYIVIEFKDDVTTARLYSDESKSYEPLKTASAKCSPEDKFSIADGAKLALERLLAEK